jgi:hypothetical protein
MTDEERASLQKQLKGVVGDNTIAEMTDAQLQKAAQAAMEREAAQEAAQDAARAAEARRALSETPSSRRKGGPIHKKAEMMGGGMYKGKKHSYAGGGMVKDMKLMRSK